VDACVIQATTYGPRCDVHPDRYGATRSTSGLRLLVVHTSEGSEGSSSAENLCSFLTSQGDRFNADGSRYGASYHYLTDTDRVLPAVPDNVVAYSAAGANHDGLHVCIPGKAAQTREQWLDTISAGYIGQLAQVMTDLAARYTIPLRRLSVADIIEGKRGYCGHHDISLAYRRSTHTDPGPLFPWDRLAQLLEEPVAVSYFKLAADSLTIWATSDNLIAVRLEGSQVNARGVDPFKVPVLPATEADKYVYHSSGLPRASVR
jgi:hypothetical protein